MDFDRYMEFVLYDTELGYYARGEDIFGAQGDFVTAPGIGSMLGRCLARQCAEVLEQLGDGCLMEFGAGTGALACDLMSELESLDRLPESYYIVDVSKSLAQRQRERINKHLPHLVDRFQWFETWPDAPFRGVLVANELLDALPVVLFETSNDGIFIRQVGLNDEGQLAWRSRSWDELHDSEEILKIGRCLLPGYRSEYNARAVSWCRELAAKISTGVAILLDYGYPHHEYYHVQRHEGTLMCHFRHHAHHDPLLYPGLQDITSHVDFTAMASAAVASGMALAGFTQLSSFLTSLGILEMSTGNPPDPESVRELKRLLMPSEMGEVFKVLALSRGIDAPLTGFSMHDRRGAL